MPGMSCKEAIRRFEEKNECSAAEAKHVRMTGMVPSIEKLDENLNTLEACEKLSISTNMIDRMIPLPRLKNLKILSLGRNNIKRIMGLEDVGQTLESLWLSYNSIDRLDGLQPCIKLHTLYISNNKIKQWDEVSKLAQLPEINNVLLVGNTIYSKDTQEESWPIVIKRVPQLGVLDDVTVSSELRAKAEQLD
jgi:dynein light chain 1